MQDATASPSATTAMPPAERRRPLLVYDGDCSFCVYSVRYWQKLTGARIDYRPYQDVAPQLPEIPLGEFRRAVQLIMPDGRRASAAEASFLVLDHAPRKSHWLWLYRHAPGFAPVSERCYAFVAAHRGAFLVVSRLLWGRTPEPPRYDLTAFIFLRLFALIYLAAFVSFAVQAQGLIGSHGILPLHELIANVAARYGPERFYLLPMVFWLNDSDTALAVVCWGGVVLAVLLACNIFNRTSLFLLYALYLSLFHAGQVFMGYQWDTFLLETGFAALLMSFVRRPGIWLTRWLLFRFMFMSGVVKLASGDPNWANWTALSYHFLTQPLPTPLAWYAAQLPPAALKFGVGITFFIELVLPFLIFTPRRPRAIAAIGIVLLETSILVTGNYNWFNLQTILLCLALFDDAALRTILPQRLMAFLLPHADRKPPPRAARIAASAVAVLVVFCSVTDMWSLWIGPPPAPARAIARAVSPFQVTGPYGLFAVMTTKRHEIVIEGSDDGNTWREYEFRYKPGDIMRAPRWNIPYQPRLDWQMWFAALEDPKRLYWFSRFLERLLQNEPTVTALLEKNPFPDKSPQYVRALYYDYTYATPDEKAKGQWWQRMVLATYFPAAHLK